MKKIISFILCLCMLLTVGQITAYAYYREPKTEGDFEYALDSNYGVAVTGYKGDSDEIVIPETLGGKPVEAIEDFAIRSDKITKVTLPESVKTIGQYAFYYCKNLKSINLENVELIASSAFYRTSIEEANLKSVKKIYSSAFSHCQKLKSVTLPKSLEKIENWTFYNCKNLSDINLENVKTVNQYAFSYCKSLKSVNLEKAELIDFHAFHSCKKLSDIKLGSKVKEIGKKAFYNTAVYKDAFNNNKKAVYIGNYLINAFTDRTKGKFKVKNGTVFIADNAFSKASTDSNVKSTVTSVSIPDSVRSIGNQALNEKSIKKIRLPKELKHLSYGAFSDNFKKKNQVFKDGCYYIGTYLMSIDKYAFSLKIRKGTTLIASGAIANSLVTKLVIPNGVKYISDDAITNCQRMKSVEIPKSVKFIGENNFVNRYHQTQNTFKNLVKITVNKSNKKYASKDGVLYNKAKTVLIAYPAGNRNKSFKVPSSVKAIKKNAFAFAPYLSEIKLNSKLETIGEAAFTNCPKLKSITIPESVKKIGYCAFGRMYFSNEDASGYAEIDDFIVYGKKGSVAEEFCNEIVYIRDYEDYSDGFSAPLNFKEV